MKMIDTTISTAYASQYGKVYKKEPVVAYHQPQFGKPYTYSLYHELSKFLSDDDSMKTEIDKHTFELLVDEDSYTLYLCPNHSEGCMEMVNKVSYCGHLTFKDSKKASDVNIRNMVCAAKELVSRYNSCVEASDILSKELKTLPETELECYLNQNDFRKFRTKYGKFFNENSSAPVVEQVRNALTLMDAIRKHIIIGRPFVEMDMYHLKHVFEDVLKNVCGISNNYISENSCVMACIIYVYDYYSSEDLNGDRIQLPAIFEVLEVLRGN